MQSSQKPIKINKTTAEIKRTYYEKNREKIIAHNIAYQREHKAEIQEKKKAYYRAKKEARLSALDENIAV